VIDMRLMRCGRPSGGGGGGANRGGLRRTRRIGGKRQEPRTDWIGETRSTGVGRAKRPQRVAAGMEWRSPAWVNVSGGQGFPGRIGGPGRSRRFIVRRCSSEPGSGRDRAGVESLPDRRRTGPRRPGARDQVTGARMADQARCTGTD